MKKIIRLKVTLTAFLAFIMAFVLFQVAYASEQFNFG